MTLSVVVAILSNLVSNVPAVLLFRPIFPALGGSEQIAAIMIASASTFAGNLTVVGSIANLIVIEQARLRNINVTFFEYLKRRRARHANNARDQCSRFWRCGPD